jgi:hypothetical protein
VSSILGTYNLRHNSYRHRCVADASHDLSNQGIFSLATEHVEETRLLRVFTKCDNVRDPTDASEIVRIVNEQSSSTQHGWFVVRNRKADEGPDFDLAAAEKELFNQDPWDSINESRRGSAMLKKYLSSLLCARIRQEFPSMQQRVKSLLGEALAARKALGDPRPTHQHRVQYLVDVVQRFQRATQQALDSPGRLPAIEMRVRSHVAARNRTFDELMRREGHWYEFEDVPNTSSPGPAQDNEDQNITDVRSPDGTSCDG